MVGIDSATGRGAGQGVNGPGMHFEKSLALSFTDAEKEDGVGRSTFYLFCNHAVRAAGRRGRVMRVFNALCYLSTLAQNVFLGPYD
jgi:hypothetical protein